MNLSKRMAAIDWVVVAISLALGASIVIIAIPLIAGRMEEKEITRPMFDVQCSGTVDGTTILPNRPITQIRDVYFWSRTSPQEQLVFSNGKLVSEDCKEARILIREAVLQKKSKFWKEWAWKS